MRKRTKVALAVAALAVARAAVWIWWPSARTGPAYVGMSDGLRSTVVLATAGEAIPAGRNAIWCASSTVAWRKMREANGGTLVVARAEEESRRLSEAADTPTVVPDGCLTVGAGRAGDHQLADSLKPLRGDASKTLVNDVAKAAPGSVVWWAHLSAAVTFPVPYAQNDRPMRFGGQDGSPVRSFGIRCEDGSQMNAQREQVRVLFDCGMLKGRAATQPAEVEFAVDLCQKSEPSQVVVARIARPASLAEGVAYVQRRTAECEREDVARFHKLAGNESLLVPDVVFEVDHRFTDLEGKQIATGVYEGVRLSMARQTIDFRLDRSGTVVESLTARMSASSDARGFAFGGPFLIYLCKRGESRPYFAMWVENTELLSRWE